MTYDRCLNWHRFNFSCDFESIDGRHRSCPADLGAKYENPHQRSENRVAIPKHAVVFFIKSVNEAKKTVNAEVPSDVPVLRRTFPKLVTLSTGKSALKEPARHASNLSEVRYETSIENGTKEHGNGWQNETNSHQRQDEDRPGLLIGIADLSYCSSVPVANRNT
jgi:hypothetical protein